MAICVVFVPAAAVGAVGVPVKAALFNGALLFKAAVITWFSTGFDELLFKASSMSIVIALLVIAAWTKAVVAIWVVLVPAVAVGAVGIPVKAGELNGALRFKAFVIVLFLTGFWEPVLNISSNCIL